jgi:ParB family chromosome partitioning protein
MSITHGLGRGLSSLIPNKQGAQVPPKPVFSNAPVWGQKKDVNDRAPIEAQDKKDAILFIDPKKISANPYQPRGSFEQSKLDELAESIREQGILSPLIVTRRDSGGYELIAGERRLRAAIMIGLAQVPVIVRSATAEQKVAIALIENIQRQDLNPIERARGLKRLIQECGHTQEAVAKILSKPRSSIANSLRLLELPDSIQESLKKGEITEGHAKVILTLPDDVARLNLWKKITANSLPVRSSEREARAIFVRPHQRKRTVFDPFLESVQQKLEKKLNTKVAIKGTGDKGQVIIEYFTREELARIGEGV